MRKLVVIYKNYSVEVVIKQSQTPVAKLECACLLIAKNGQRVENHKTMLHMMKPRRGE